MDLIEWLNAHWALVAAVGAGLVYLGMRLQVQSEQSEHIERLYARVRALERGCDCGGSCDGCQA